MQNTPVHNTRATHGKYRFVTSSDWNTVLEQYRAGKGISRTDTGTAFTRAEIEYLERKYGRTA